VHPCARHKKAANTASDKEPNNELPKEKIKNATKKRLQPRLHKRNARQSHGSTYVLRELLAMNTFAAQKLKFALKDLLKQRKIRHEDLATKLECSIPTVKRILGNEEITLTRLLEILEILNVSLGELELMSKDQAAPTPSYTPKQSKYLAQNPSHFAYLMKLYAGQNPNQIAKKYGLSARSTDKYLIGLEKHELIRVTGAQKVKPTHKAMPTLGRGELAQKYHRSFIQSGADFFKAHIDESLSTTEKDRPKGGFVLQGIKVSRETYTNWVTEREKHFSDFQRMAAFEEKTRPENELMTAVTIEAFALVPNNHPEIEALDEILGKIE